MPFSWLRSFGSIVLALVGTACWGQTTLSLASGSGVPGGTVSLGLVFNDLGGNQTAGLQWAFEYPASSIAAVTVSAAPALTAASKTISCAAIPGRLTCLATGMNDNLIPNGLIASAQFTLSTSATSANIVLDNALGASVSGNSVQYKDHSRLTMGCMPDRN
jgi:hypothetical protein